MKTTGWSVLLWTLPLIGSHLTGEAAEKIKPLAKKAATNVVQAYVNEALPLHYKVSGTNPRVFYSARTLVADDGGVTTMDRKAITKLNGLLENMEQAFSRVFGRFEAHSVNPPRIYLTKDASQYDVFMMSIKGTQVNSQQSGGFYEPKSQQLTTFGRSSDRSLYSLEELLKHEFSHYLQHKYFRLSNRFSDWHLPEWYFEGAAEFLVGLRGKKVLVRRNSISQVKVTSLRASDLVRGRTPRGESHYPYRNAFVGFLFEKRPSLFKKLSDSLYEREFQRHFKRQHGRNYLPMSYASFQADLGKFYQKWFSKHYPGGLRAMDRDFANFVRGKQQVLALARPTLGGF